MQAQTASGWQTVASGGASDFAVAADGQSVVATKIFTPVQAVAVKVVFTAAQTAPFVWISEAQVWNTVEPDVAAQRFDAFGNLAAQTAAFPTFGYTGREPDASGLIYYRARYYDPASGGFLSRDPIGLAGGINRYAYAGNNPANFNDPSGLVANQISNAATQAVNYFVSGQASQAYKTYSLGASLLVDTMLNGGGPVGFHNALQDYAHSQACASIGADCGLESADAEFFGVLLAGLGQVARVGAGVANNTTRGISSHGRVFSSTVNEAGGEIWTSSGQIAQKDFVTHVNSGLYKGDVNIISGVHGTAEGTTMVDASLYEADLARFGDIPGVKVHNFPDLTPEQVRNLLTTSDTTIGGFCYSGVCLEPYIK